MNIPIVNLDAATELPDADFSDLALDDRVHSSIYTDSRIFEIELERIFYNTWVYIGHESEIPKNGDYRLRQIGRQPVIMSRGAQGTVNVMFNRCRHRGAVVAETESGRTKFFRCWYHGWVYDADGELVQIPGDEAYEQGHCDKIGGLARPARVESYRGFIFASVTENVPDLREHLGKGADMLDYLVDASPTGKVLVNAGVNKTKFKGNWKLVGMDGYHVNYVHAAVLDAWEKASDDSGASSTHSNEAFEDDSLSVTRDLGRGHCMLDFRAHRMKYADGFVEKVASMPGGKEYRDALLARHGDERGTELLVIAGDPHVGIYPNMQIISNQIRIINPIAAGETEVLMFPVLFDGVPKEINTTRLRQHEYFYGAAGAGSPDDSEIFERVQRGLQASSAGWIDISRGLNREQQEADGTTVGKITDEVTQRAQIREWRRLMTENA